VDSVCIGLISSNRVTFAQNLPVWPRHANRSIGRRCRLKRWLQLRRPAAVRAGYAGQYCDRAVGEERSPVLNADLCSLTVPTYVPTVSPDSRSDLFDDTRHLSALANLTLPACRARCTCLTRPGFASRCQGPPSG